MKNLRPIFLSITSLLLSVNFNNVNAQYCTPNPSSVDGTGITRVVCGTIDNVTGAEAGNYGDYSAQSNFELQGTTVTVDITYQTGYIYYTRIWVDFDDDNNFTTAGDLVYTGQSTSANPTTLNASFTLPGGAPLGAHRMRIAGRYTNATDPCYTGSWGSYEDYTLIITSPAPMSFTSSTTTQNNITDVAQGITNQEIIGIEVVTTGSTSSFDATQFQINIGTTNLADITGNINVYYTGTSSTFSTTTLFGSIASGTGTLNINGIQTLATATNYFWITYDIAAAATIGNTVDAVCSQITMNGGIGNQTPLPTSPTGSRTITDIPVACGGLGITLPYSGGFETGLGEWSQSATDNFDWETETSGVQNSTTTGPISAHEGATYLYTETSSPRVTGDIAIIESSCFNFSTCSSPQITFRHHMYGTSMGSLDLEVEATPGSGTWISVWNKTGQQHTSETQTWSLATVDLSAYGNSYVRLRFKGVRGNNYYSDMAIDDIAVTCNGPMTYFSSEAIQLNTSTVSACSANQEIIGIQVEMSGILSSLDITQFQINMNGTTNVLDVSNVDIFYTGTSSVYADTNLFANAIPSGGTIVINGSQVLFSGTNYFWVAYDIASGATPTNNLDAQCTQITVDGVNRFPTITNPVGNRTITACVISPGGVSGSITAWFDSKNGPDNTSDGGVITTWLNNAGNTNIPNVSQSTNSNKPLYRTDRINWNPIVEFDGANDYMYQAATLGSDLFDPSENTVFMMHIAKSGLVYFKWEHQDNFTDRMGFEISSGKPRFDFPSSDLGDQTIASTSFTTVGEIVTGHTTSNVSTLRMNGVVNVTKNTTGTLGTGLTRQFVIGNNTTSLPLPCEIDFAELIIYKTSLSTLEMNRVESYMAIKYGITLGGNGAGITYSSPYGNSIWDANTGYHNDVTGVAKDLIAQTLDQPKSMTLNVGSTMPFTIAHSSIDAPTAFSTDNSYIVVGHDGGDVINNTSVAYTHATTAIQVQLKRIFRVQTTNLSTGKALNEMEVELDMSNVPGLSGMFGLGGANAAADLRLLLDDNIVFGQGTVNERAYTNSGVTGNLIRFKIPFTDLPANGTYFFTIGSINKLTAPLPVEIQSFNVVCDKEVRFNWTTSTEVNNDYFTIERSFDGINFEIAGTVSGAGNSAADLHYQFIDDNTNSSTAYYRLKQTDFDGNFSYSKIVTAKCDQQENNSSIYPNPAKDNLTIIYNNPNNIDAKVELIITTPLGCVVLKDVFKVDSGLHKNVDISRLSGGVYHIELISETIKEVHKLIISK